VEQSQLDIRECLKHHHPSSNSIDDKDDIPMAKAAFFFFFSCSVFIYFETHFIFPFLDNLLNIITLGYLLLCLPLPC
jgi:hypothetical protein